MRRNFHCRKLYPTIKDINSCREALQGKDALDTDVLAYPATTVLVAEDGKDQVFMPVQVCYLMETLGYKDVSDVALASAMKQFVSILVWEGRKAGHGELLFLGNNEQTNAFALNNGFELIEYQVYRLRHEATQVLNGNDGGSHESNNKD